MRTAKATGRRRHGGRARWASTAAASVAVIAATGAAVGNAAASVPTRADFDYLGTFANVPSAPEGTPPISGIASMVVTTRATTTAIDAEGLNPKNVYIADVHDQPCFVDEGGNRFLFDPNGPRRRRTRSGCRRSRSTPRVGAPRRPPTRLRPGPAPSPS